MSDFAVTASGCLEGTRVAVVGGGLAGLMAASILSAARVKVTVFEASDRFGGRVYTSPTFIPGKTVEVGAELIGENHPTWRLLARMSGLNLVPVSTEGDHKAKGLRARLRCGNVDVSDRDKARMLRELEPVLQRIGKEAQGIDPLRPWSSPNAVRLDARSVAERLDDPDMFGPKSRPNSRLARCFLELVLDNDQCAPPSKQSYLGLLAAVSAHRVGSDMLGYWKSTETHRCAGGNQQLADYLAKPLRDARLNTPVFEIALEEDHVRVGSGWFQRYEDFDFAVLAAPPAGWPAVKSSPPFRPADFTMAHGPAVKFLSRFDSRFWEQRKLAPIALWDELGSVWEATDKQPPGRGGFGLSVYSGGTLVKSQRQYETAMNQLYPDYNRLMRGTLFADWPNAAWIRTGYSVPAPGQVTTVSKRLSTPFLQRLFFAGEQASPGFFGYMEGALQSGNHAAYQIALARWQECSFGEHHEVGPPWLRREPMRRVYQHVATAMHGNSTW